MEDDKPQCCGEYMVLRKNGRTGDSFWGCAQFPACDRTVSARDWGFHLIGDPEELDAVDEMLGVGRVY